MITRVFQNWTQIHKKKATSQWPCHKKPNQTKAKNRALVQDLQGSLVTENLGILYISVLLMQRG
jgi:hypothetical protein